MLRRLVVASVIGIAACAVLSAQNHEKLRFRVEVDPAISSGAVSGRLIVLMTNNTSPQDVLTPAFGEGPAKLWMAAREIQDLAPGTSVDVDADEIAAPQPLSDAPIGDYQVMALLDVDHNAAYNIFSNPDLRSAVVAIKGLNPAQTTPIELRLSEHVKQSPSLQLGKGQELINFVSPSLTKFWGRAIHMRGIVVLPPDYTYSKMRYPTVYFTHGFGDDLDSLASVAAEVSKSTAEGNLPPMIWVLLDESCPTGTHEFADSVNNGPWGYALTRELIPSLENRYRMDSKPRGRFLTGHSSGGWSTMWLQVSHPDIFGGTWSTSPDPVDFRDFVNIDLTKQTNVYNRLDNQPTPLIRIGEKDVMSFEQFSRQELVLGGYGGQIASFEWVFSPRGEDGRPMLMFDRKTGVIQREVAAYWVEHFNISQILSSHATQLVPQLRGKIHIIVGTADTFYLDGPVRLLQQTVASLGYDAKFTYLEGRTHFDLFKGGLNTRIAQAMYEVARPGNTWKPKVAPDPATELSK